MQVIKTYRRTEIRDEHGAYIYKSCEIQINDDLEEHKNWSIKSFSCNYEKTYTSFITVVFDIKDEDKILVE